MKMKIIVGAALTLLTLAPQLAIAQNRSADVINVLAKGDRLAFASIGDYRRAVDQPSEETKKQFAHTVAALRGFTSFAKKQNSSPTLRTQRDQVASLIRDEYFASILNPDLVVQIGDHIFRVNPSTEHVYALPAANEKEYGDLIAENTGNSHVQRFSTGDNVLELIQTGGMSTNSLFCGQSGIGGYTNAAPFGTLTASADFNRYGLYFSLSASVSPIGSSGFMYTFEFTGGIGSSQGYVYYKPRCGNPVGYAISTKGSWTGTRQKYQSYQGSTNLNQVYFRYRIKNSGTGQYMTPYVGFRVNK
jgi:hypothetical protein